MTIQDRVSLRKRLMAFGLRGVIGALLKSCRCRCSGLDHLLDASMNGPCALLLWHEQLVPVAALLKRVAPHLFFTAVVSKSRDAALLAELVRTYSDHGQVLEVAHSARPAAITAISELLNEQKRILVATPDGPRGPRHKFKRGLVQALITSQARVVIMRWKASRSWKLSTWDEMAVPLPFSHLEFSFSAPLQINATDEVETIKQNLEHAMQL